MSEIPSAVPNEPVVLYHPVTRRQVEQARQTPQGRMHGVLVIPDRIPVEDSPPQR